MSTSLSIIVVEISLEDECIKNKPNQWRKMKRIHLLVCFIHKMSLFSSTSYAQQIPWQTSFKPQTEIPSSLESCISIWSSLPQINQAIFVRIPVSHSERSAFYSNLIVAVRVAKAIIRTLPLTLIFRLSKYNCTFFKLLQQDYRIKNNTKNI